MSVPNGLDPDLAVAAEQLFNYAVSQGYGPVFTSGVRSWWKQLELYARYMAGRSQFPAARPGWSAHQYGWAFDMVAHPDPAAYEDLGAVWEDMGGTWGGRFGDRVHFELPGASETLRGATEEQVAAYWYPSVGAYGIRAAHDVLSGVNTAISWVG